METANVMPWDDLADAFERLTDARRALECADDPFDRALAALEVHAAEAKLQHAQDVMGAVASNLMRALVRDGGYLCKDTKDALAEMLGFSLCLSLAKTAQGQARAAEQRAQKALNEMDALWCRIRELEEQIAKRTPGVGEPTMRVVG